MTRLNGGKAYIVGGGIAALSAAVLLIRDAGVSGANIHILEELPVAGGALDASGDPVHGYVTRGGRMLTEDTYVCLWDVLDSIPSLRKPGVSVKHEVWDFNRTWRSEAHARLIDGNHSVLDASDLGFNVADRVELVRLLTTSETTLGARRIDQCFSTHFLDSNFWAMWRTTFAFQNWHSAAELRRYMLRFLQEFPRIHTLAGVRRTPLNQYDSIVRPMLRWLQDRGVVFEHGVRVTDADFEGHTSFRRITALHALREGRELICPVGPDDIALITIGSMTADARRGDDRHAPDLVREPCDGAWTLWRNLARKTHGLGRPQVFCGDVDQTKWESFTLTMRSPVLLERIERYAGNSPGTGGLMTFKDSSWLMSIVVPRPPHFDGQPDDVSTLWGYGLFVDQPGDYLRKPMSKCSGQEILTELIYQLGFEDIIEEVRRTTTVIPVMMPYITSEFQCRAEGDRPPVIPQGAENFAFLGQYVEIPRDVVFTVEYSVRAAMHAVYGLLGIEKEIPAIFEGISDPKTLLAGLKTLAA
jgi:oleate hydratase